MIVEDLTTALQTTGRKVYPVMFPRNPSFPVITYQLISAPHEHAFDRTVGDVQARYQIDVWGADIATVRTTAKAAVTAVLAIANPSTHIDSITIENETEGREPDQETYRRTLEVLIVHDAE